MNRKKAWLFILVLFCISVISVGYAALSKDITIGGTISTADDETLKDAHLKVHWATNGVDTLDYRTSMEPETTIGEQTCSITCSLTTKTDYVIFTNDLINDSEEYKIKITPVVKVGNEILTLSDGYYKYIINEDFGYRISVLLDKTQLVSKEINADKAKATIKIELLKTPIEKLEGITITIAFNMEAVEKD